jgi:hypothetical protein
MQKPRHKAVSRLSGSWDSDYAADAPDRQTVLPFRERRREAREMERSLVIVRSWYKGPTLEGLSGDIDSSLDFTINLIVILGNSLNKFHLRIWVRYSPRPCYF